MTENELLTGVLDVCRLLGWRTIHLRPARSATSWRTAVHGVGFPDVLAVRGSRIVAAELKVGRKQLTAEQGRWLTDLAAAGADCHVWRETDYPDGIVEALR